MPSANYSAQSARSIPVRSCNLVMLLGLLATLAGCGASDCRHFVGHWQGHYALSPQHQGEVKLVIRTDFSLSVTADEQISGGNWQCKNSGEIVLNDRASVPMSLLWLGENKAKIPVNSEEGRPEVLFSKQVEPAEAAR